MNISKWKFGKNRLKYNINEGGVVMLKAQDLAKYIITKCTLDGKPISNLQLQKILYFIQGAFYNQFNTPLFNDDFKAWDYGPVIESVYNEYKKYGSSTISEVDINFQLTFSKEPDSENYQKTVDIVIEALREINPWELVSISHEDDTPWAKNYKIWWPVIDSIQIENYFKNNNEIFRKLGVDFSKSPCKTDVNSNENKKILDFFNKLNDLKKSVED